ncbi:hypothetical protein C6P45_002614 [Maudiozyma exigua]|uniref:Maintenance of telomere capping protein 1 n=1 Tax=Maudiozyma exigua TaxID=34358 RepID=A0A9P6VXW3_MAUEX|nr:hypothetical protein C6P45_002614 [Kazachstania exigua]
MSDDKKLETDEFMEFLDNLPEGTASKAGDSSGPTENKEDIMKFLDDLEKDTKKGEGNPVERNKEEKKEEKPVEEKPVEEKKDTPTAAVTGEKKDTETETHTEPDTNTQAEEPLDDPITSISNWWSSSGANTVSSLWNKTTEQATQLKNRIAQEQAALPLPLPPINSVTISELAKSLQKIVVGETEEVLRIHLVHDLVNYSYLQYHVEQRFDQVLSDQVQGGIRIFVDEWGKPNKDVSSNNTSTETHVLNSDDIGNNGNVSIVKNPIPVKRQLNVFNGKLTDGEKLAFANLEDAVKLFNKAHEELVRQQEVNGDKDDKSQDNANISDIFISIIPVSIPTTGDSRDKITTTDASQSGNFSFTIVLKDITNDITSTTRSQGFPSKWIHWLEGGSVLRKENEPNTPKKNGNEEEEDEEQVDPSEWVQDWIEDGISLVLGVVAQNYVVERMGFN